MRSFTVTTFILLALGLTACQDFHQKHKVDAQSRWNEARVNIALKLTREQYESGRVFHWCAESKRIDHEEKGKDHPHPITCFTHGDFLTIDDQHGSKPRGGEPKELQYGLGHGCGEKLKRDGDGLSQHSGNGQGEHQYTKDRSELSKGRQTRHAEQNTVQREPGTALRGNLRAGVEAPMPTGTILSFPSPPPFSPLPSIQRSTSGTNGRCDSACPGRSNCWSTYCTVDDPTSGGHLQSLSMKSARPRR